MSDSSADRAGSAQPFKVRPARRGDAPAISAILSEVGGKADNHTVTWVISHPEMEVLVAADAHDKAVGVVTLSHRPLLHVGGRAAIIDEIAVLTAWRRQGVGRGLMAKTLERAGVLGVKRLQVESRSADDTGFGAFMAACGLTPVDVGVYRLG